MLLASLLLACRCTSAPEAMELTFPEPSLHQVGGRFHGEPEEPISAQLAFQAKALCPRITRVVATPANNGIWEVRAFGENLDRVKRIGAALATGPLADAAFERDGGALVFPVACGDCEVFLGVEVGQRTVACFGPGYSIRWKDGVPQGG